VRGRISGPGKVADGNRERGLLEFCECCVAGTSGEPRHHQRAAHANGSHDGRRRPMVMSYHRLPCSCKHRDCVRSHPWLHSSLGADAGFVCRSLEGCSVRCAGALALRSRLAAHMSLRCCFVGGLGPLDDRALDGLVARGNSSLGIVNCSVGACLFAGLRAHENAVAKVVNSSISHCGLALGFYGNCLIG
jgi:hypothetical protein